MPLRPDTVIENATVVTGDPARPYASRVGMWNGTFLALDEDLDAFARPVHVIDAGGATVLPGFNDVHAHSVWFGQTLMEIDLGSCATTAEVYRTIRQQAGTPDDPADGTWVVASNFHPLALEDGPLRIDVLDDVGGGRPLVIKHNSGHALTVNTEALRRAGIALADPDQPDGGEIRVDDRGRPTGLLDENAMRPVQDLLQPESEGLITRALDLATSRYVSEGLTSVTDAGIAGGWIGHSPREFGAYQTALDRGLLSTRMQTMVTIDALHEVAGSPEDPVVRSLSAGVRTGVGDEWLQIGPAKIFTDGSLIGSTAAMSEDYHHCTHHRGYFQGDPGVMRDHALRAAAGGWSLAMHAIGDAAVDYAVDVLAEARRRFGPPVLPHRIEHGGVVRDDQLAAIAAVDAVLVPQPRFIAEFGDAMADKLGPTRSALSYPAQRVLDAGVVLPGSSDRPVAGGAPLSVIQAFVERRTETGRDYGPADRITAAQAVQAYTVGSARATGWAGRKGQIIPGQLADLVVLGQDPTDPGIDPSQIADIPVLATVVGGTTAFGDDHWTARSTTQEETH